MSKLLYLECNMGAAGDMLAAALYELLEDAQKQEFLHLVNEHGIPGVEVVPEDSIKCGVKGTHMSVRIHGEEEETQPYGAKDMHHEHGHEHHHTSLADVHAMIQDCQLPEKVKEDACKVYDLLAAAESHAHGVEVSEIHFHEVGSVDALIDVVGSCLALELLGVDEVQASPICVGNGTVRSAHGILPVPAPATAEIIKGMPVYCSSFDGELLTPTGAAILKYFVESYTKEMHMEIEEIGYGFGTKDFAQLSCVRAFLGYQK